MEIFYQLVNFILFLLGYLESIMIISILVLGIILFNLICFLSRDLKTVKIINNFQDPENLSINSLENLPLVNIIIPAWKEGEIFKELLTSINNLEYPNLKVIVNAGGSEETLEIAKSFEKFDKFVILQQMGGADRPSLGKVKAINEALDYISNGIVYFIDADSYIIIEILLRMIYPIINHDEDVVLGAVRPLKRQENIGLVKYLLIDRFIPPGFKFTRYAKGDSLTGQNFCVKSKVIKSVGKFSENKKIATDKSMGKDLYSKGYKAYQLVDYRHRIYVDYSSTFKEYLNQKTIWLENKLTLMLKTKKLGLIKFIALFGLSLYILIFPFLLLLNFGLFIIGILLLLAIYLKKIKKYLIFKKLVDRKFYPKFSFVFFIQIIYYIYVDIIIVIRVPFHFIYFILKLKFKK